MGVVVQVMVSADVAGILFTANPSTGERAELVVNASFGLGESVVAGHVTPDSFVLDRSSLELKESVIGAKDQMVVSDTRGTVTRPVPEEKRDEASLPEDLLRQLAVVGVEVERLFDGVPQDIEWAVAKGKCWLLQSRPITHLPAAPLRDVTWDPPSSREKLVRRQVVENMPEPLSPLFEELYLHVGLDHAMDQVMGEFGMSLDIEQLIERPMFLTVNGFAYCRANYRSTWRLLWIMPKLLFDYAKLSAQVVTRRGLRFGSRSRCSTLLGDDRTVEVCRSAGCVGSAVVVGNPRVDQGGCHLLVLRRNGLGCGQGVGRRR